MSRTVMVAIVGAVASVSAALADTSVDTAAKWGLLGTWRFDCAKRGGPSDPDYVYVVREGRLFLDRVFDTSTESNPIESASMTPSGELEVVVKFGMFQQTRQMTLLMQADGRVRVVSNKNLGDGEYSIRDGKFIASGKATTWASRCRDSGS